MRVAVVYRLLEQNHFLQRGTRRCNNLFVIIQLFKWMSSPDGAAAEICIWQGERPDTQQSGKPNAKGHFCKLFLHGVHMAQCVRQPADLFNTTFAGKRLLRRWSSCGRLPSSGFWREVIFRVCFFCLHFLSRQHSKKTNNGLDQEIIHEYTA